MRTTLDLPDELMRRAKAVAAMRGMKLKELVQAFIEQGLSESREPATPATKGDLPNFFPKSAKPMRSLTNAEIEAIFVAEDRKGTGFDRSA